MKHISVLWILGCLLFSQSLFAEDDTVKLTKEYKIKAGYVYNFTKFITWNFKDAKTFNVCIVGNDPFDEIIDPIEDKPGPAPLPIKLFRFIGLDTLHKGPHCHTLFVSSSIKGSLNHPNFDNTLVVGESDDFIEHGGMIRFVNREDKIKLQCNLERINEAGLKISAKVIEVCEVVKNVNNDGVFGPFVTGWLRLSIAGLMLSIAGYFVYKQFNKA